MTQDKLLELAESLPIAELEKLTEQEVEAYFAPYYNVTRPAEEKLEKVKATLTLPEKKERKKKISKVEEAMKNMTPEQREKLAQLQKEFKIL